MIVAILCRLIPANEVAAAINYAIRKQFYTAIYSWSKLDKKTYKLWLGFFAVSICQI
jgi:hypothetical protein